MPKTMYEKIWEDHLVRESEGDTSIIYVDRQLIHEVTRSLNHPQIYSLPRHLK